MRALTWKIIGYSVQENKYQLVQVESDFTPENGLAQDAMRISPVGWTMNSDDYR